MGEEFSRWKISKFGFVIGILVGLLYFALADVARMIVGLVHSTASSSGSGLGLTLSSNLFNFVEGGYYLALVAALVVVKIAHRTIKGPLEVRGPIKCVMGALTGLFYYLILAGGVVTFIVGIASPASGRVSRGESLSSRPNLPVRVSPARGRGVQRGGHAGS